MIGLEYLLLFGLPENKIENLYDDRTRVGLAFPNRAEAELHYTHWVQELSAWQDGGPEPTVEGTAIGPFLILLEGCCVHVMVPLDFSRSSNCHFLERQRGDTSLDPWTVLSNLKRIFKLCFHSTELLLTPQSQVAPLAYLGATPVKGTYLEGIPRLILEQINDFGEARLRQEKLRFYQQVGIPEIWLLDPALQQIEAYPQGCFLPGQTFLSNGVAVDPAQVFEGAIRRGTPEGWLNDEETVGLQQFLLAGMPCRKYEYYQGWCRRFLPCQQAAPAVFARVQAEAQRWAPGRFRISLDGDSVEVAVPIDGTVHRRFLEYYHFTGQWD